MILTASSMAGQQPIAQSLVVNKVDWLSPKEEGQLEGVRFVAASQRLPLVAAAAELVAVFVVVDAEVTLVVGHHHRKEERRLVADLLVQGEPLSVVWVVADSNVARGTFHLQQCRVVVVVVGGNLHSEQQLQLPTAVAVADTSQLPAAVVETPCLVQVVQQWRLMLAWRRAVLDAALTDVAAVVMDVPDLVAAGISILAAAGLVEKLLRPTMLAGAGAAVDRLAVVVDDAGQPTTVAAAAAAMMGSEKAATFSVLLDDLRNDPCCRWICAARR